MIVKCEKCEVSFKINESVVKKEGSKFRCSKCDHVFMIYPPEPEPSKEPEPVKTPEPSKQPEPVKTPEPSKQPEAGKDSHPSESHEPVKNNEFDFIEEETSATDEISGGFGAFDGSKERYLELKTIGKGGMGEVLLAQDTQLKRKVAIKALREEYVKSPDAVGFFVREAVITAQLDHPNIVPLYTVKQPGKHRKSVSFVMKLVKGKNLQDIITRARNEYNQNPKAELEQELRLRSRLEYFLKACEGITYAHNKKVIHRDLKPANIMVGGFGEVYVMDWGIAKVIKDIPHDEADETKSEGIIGTVSFMSPEQAKGLPDVGIGSDIFSLGAVLYELVTLKPARIGDSEQKMEWAEKGHLNHISHVAPEIKIDPELKAIISKATEFQPKDRYLSVADLAEDVRCYIRGEEVSALPDNYIRKFWRFMNKHWAKSLIAFLSMLLLFMTVGIGSLIWKQFALKAAQFRENRLTYLQAKVSSQAHKIDLHFLRLEELAINLANNAMYLIQDAPPNSEKFYWIQDFNDPTKSPPDLEYSELYKRPVSIEYPVTKAAPEINIEDITPVMKRLAPLRHHFKKLLLDSRNSLAPVGEEESRRLLTVYGLPVRWVYIGLEVGVMYSYPGKGTYPDDYDPRIRPWYILGKNRSSVAWGNPYRDLQGQGLVLACAAPLYDNRNQFAGVVGMDVTFGDIIRDNLTRRGAVGVIESFLLDDKGRIVVRSSQLDAEITGASENSSTLDLKPFPVKDVVKAINKGESGLVEIKHEKESRIIVFCEMPSVNWYYVEEIDIKAILKKGENEE